MAKQKNDSFRSVDKLAKELDNIDSFVLKNWKKYVYIAVAFVIIIAVGLYYYESKEKINTQASQEIVTAKTAAELKDVIAKYPKFKSVDYSRLDLAAKYFDNKEYDKAIATYQDEVDHGSDAFAKNLAALNKCYVIAEKGDKVTAVSAFEKIADNKIVPEFIRAEAAYAGGRMLMDMGRKKDAITYLKLCISFKNSKGWDKLAKNIININV
jgi:predicted negative regulator of RcsB-dependent stress response